MSNSIEQLSRLLKSSGQTDDTPEDIRKAMQNNPSLSRAVEKLTESDLEKISAILNDRQALSSLMSTPKARALLKKFKG